MRALVFDGELRLDHNHPLPHRESGEALVRVIAAGICTTDLEIVGGYMGFRGVLGHEFVGIVEEADDPTLAGERVVGEINCACGHCAICRAGLARHCPQRSVIGILGRDGVFAEYVAVPESNLHSVPSSVEDEEAVFVEPLAAAFEILEQVHLLPTSQVTVLGDGRLGLLVAQVLALGGAHVVMVGHHPNKLELARSLGIDTMPLEHHPLKRADVVVECTGSHAGLATAATLVRARGTIVLKSTVAGKLEIDLAPLVIDEVSVVGSRCGPFQPALRALQQEHVQVKPLITEQYDLAEGVAAMQRARQRDTLKVLLRPWQSLGDQHDWSPQRLAASHVRPSTNA